MRRRLAFLILLSLSLPLIAAAQDQPVVKKQAVVIPPKVTPLALRGAQSAKPATTPPPLPQNPAVRMQSAAFSPIVSPDAPFNESQCRLSCAQTYYFCLAGESPESCPQNWSSCLSDCRQSAEQQQGR